MATRGNRTCVQLQNVSKTGFLNNSDSLIIKGTWFPQNFSLAVTDGVGAWKAEVSEDLATRIAGDLQITTTQFIDKAQLHLGQQKANFLYSLHYVSSDEVQLLCNPTEDDLDLNMKFSIDLVLVTVSVVEITFDMVKFLLDAYTGLKEDSERHARACVREQAVIENSMTSLKSELQMMKTSGFKACEETLALVSVPSTAGGGKRKKFDSSEDIVSGKRSSQQQHQQQQQAASKLRRSTSGTRDSARLGLAPVPLAVGIEEGNGASRVGVSAEEQEIIGEESNEDRSNGKVLAMFNIDGSLEHLVPIEKKKRGRPRKSLMSAEAITNKSQLLPVEVSGAAHNPGGLIELASEGDRAAEHRIAEHAAKAIKLLEPFANPMSTKLLLKDCPEREIPSSPEGSAELALAVPVNKESVVPEAIKEFEVINADFHNFDNGRTKQEMAMGQHWALYDDQDGMPRFYGRICNFIPEPFEAEVEWFEPHRPAHRPSGLMKSLGLSAACGEFKLGSVSDQPLAAFSHRIEILDARKGIYKFYPCKGDVWALYKDWDEANINFKQLKNNGEVKLCYDLVEVRVEFVKEKGVKVVPLVKVPNFRTMFQAGNPMMAYWILPKDMRDRFSHQIATHRFDGNEIDFGVPRGAFELDSASTPDEYMLAPAENKIDTPVLAT